MSKDTKKQEKHYCNRCNKEGTTKRCSKCKQAYYCNIVCQQADWYLQHNEECGLTNDEIRIKRFLSNQNKQEKKETQDMTEVEQTHYIQKWKFLEVKLRLELEQKGQATDAQVIEYMNKQK